MDRMEEILRDLCRISAKPFYLFDEEALDGRMEEIRTFLGEEIGLCYAMKGNSFLAGRAASLADRIEVCSYGEYLICREAGISPDKLLISGVLKKPDEFRDIMENCGQAAVYTVESACQFEILKRGAENLGKPLSFLVRLTSGNQFGVDEQELLDLCKRASQSAYLRLRGIHFFSGTMKRKAHLCSRELARLDELMVRIEEETGLALTDLEYGPGLPVAYFRGQECRDEEFFSAIREAADRMTWRGRLTLEMGRAISYAVGHYATRVMDIKQNDGVLYCIVDGGMHQLHYDGQIKGMLQPEVRRIPGSSVGDFPCGDWASKGRSGSWTVCGSLCTGNDVLAVGLPLEDLRPGDWLVFAKTGAYSFAEGMALFLSHELPDIIGFSDQEGLRYFRKDMETWKFNTGTKETMI